MEQITPLIEQANINALVDYYEYNPNLYGLNEIDCAELTANNVTEMLREQMQDFVERILLEYGYKLRETDTLHIFNIICHHMWGEITAIQEYYFHECDKTRKAILEKMECHEVSTHMEDYMNEPQ